MTSPTRTGFAAIVAAALGDDPSPSPADDEPPMTSWGVPDLTGTWDFATITPFNRPERFADREYLTEEEYSGWNDGARRGRERNLAAPSRPAPEKPTQGDVDVGYNSFFIDAGQHLSPNRRTSIVVDPPNGRTPGLTPAALMRYAEMREKWEHPPRTPADRPPATRCLVGFNAGPPMSSGAYNNLMRIFQSPGHIGILNEMVNDHRVIATDGGDHMADNVRFWKGDSRGRWEGNTFVVETRQFRPETNFRGSGPNMHLTERFTPHRRRTRCATSTRLKTPRCSRASLVDRTGLRAHRRGHLRVRLPRGQPVAPNADAGREAAVRSPANAVPDETWLPTWYKWMPKKADLLAQAGRRGLSGKRAQGSDQRRGGDQ